MTKPSVTKDEPTVVTNPVGAYNEARLRHLVRLHDQGRLAHAYLFSGPAGAGKRETALALAKLVNCLDRPEKSDSLFCGACPSCRKIDSGNHPDVTVIDTGEEASIKIAAVRELITQSQMRPYEARYKVYIIVNADDLTIEGGNALLKTLEEPAKQSLLILTSAMPEKIMATVKSRCQIFRFPPMAVNRMTRFLVDEQGWEEEESIFFSRFTEGTVNRALTLKQDDFFRRKNEIIDNIVFARNNESYLKTVLPEKERTRELLEVVKSWFRDLLLIKAGVDTGGIIHVDRRKDLTQLASRYSFDQVEAILNQAMATTRLLDENLNVKIAVTLLRDRICSRS